MKKCLYGLLIMALAITLSITAAQAGKIVVNNDEWTLTNSPGFTSLNDPGVFANNVATWFTGGGKGSFLAYSSDHGLIESNLNNAMITAGHSWTVDQTPPQPDLATMQTYDGVFLGGGLTVDNNVLIQYVEGGGNVYIMGGTGVGGAAAEAARWNVFLNHFGLSYASFYNGVQGSIPISSTHPIFAGVDHLYQNNGNSISDLFPADPSNQILVFSGSSGLYAVYESPATPIPGAVWLVGTGLIGLIGLRIRK